MQQADKRNSSDNIGCAMDFQMEQQGGGGNGNNGGNNQGHQGKPMGDIPSLLQPDGGAAEVAPPLPMMPAPPMNRDPRMVAQQHQHMMGHEERPSLLGAPPPVMPLLPGKQSRALQNVTHGGVALKTACSTYLLAECFSHSFETLRLRCRLGLPLLLQELR